MSTSESPAPSMAKGLCRWDSAKGLEVRGEPGSSRWALNVVTRVLMYEGGWRVSWRCEDRSGDGKIPAVHLDDERSHEPGIRAPLEAGKGRKPILPGRFQKEPALPTP